MRPDSLRSTFQDYREDISHRGLKTVVHNHCRFTNAYFNHQVFKLKRYLGLDNRTCDIEGCDRKAKYFFPLSPIPDYGSNGENIKVGELSTTDGEDSFDVVKWTGLKNYAVIGECEAHY